MQVPLQPPFRILKHGHLLVTQDFLHLQQRAGLGRGPRGAGVSLDSCTVPSELEVGVDGPGLEVSPGPDEAELSIWELSEADDEEGGVEKAGPAAAGPALALLDAASSHPTEGPW